MPVYGWKIVHLNALALCCFSILGYIVIYSTLKTVFLIANYIFVKVMYKK